MNGCIRLQYMQVSSTEYIVMHISPNKSSCYCRFYLDDSSKDYRILVKALLGRLEV
jgi:hypothetical protein